MAIVSLEELAKELLPGLVASIPLLSQCSFQPKLPVKNLVGRSRHMYSVTAALAMSGLE
jgi:hypothetical protein